MSARGIRNNNPGNIMRVTGFKGETGFDADGYAVFDNAHDGIRAIARILFTYHYQDGIGTIEQIISRWAPESAGNDTAAYIADVCDRSGLQRDTLAIWTRDNVAKIVTAIIWHECGSCPYDASDIAAAVNDAWIQ